MPLHILQDQSGQGPEKVHDDTREYFFHVQVFGNGTVFIDTTKQNLLNQVVGQNGGLQFTAAMGIVQSIRWKGPLWAMGSTKTTLVCFVFPGSDLSDGMGGK